MLDETDIEHNEKVMKFSDKEAMDYTELSSNHGYFVFTKPGTYTLTISYKYNPEISEKFTFNVTGDELYTDNPVPAGGKGDINGNSKIDMTDYILLKRAYFGTYGFSARQNDQGDINDNGKIDMTDYILLKRMYFGTYKI